MADRWARGRDVDNPILNSPYLEPTPHFHLDDDGITSRIVDGRRESASGTTA